MGLDHSAVIRAMMFPFAPPPGQFLGSRPTAQVPDGPLSDDDRTGIRVLYPDPNDTVNIGAIRGQILPANPFALAAIPAPSTGSSVTGMVGAQVVAMDADTGAIVAGAFLQRKLQRIESAHAIRWLLRSGAPARWTQLQFVRRTAGWYCASV